MNTEEWAEEQAKWAVDGEANPAEWAEEWYDGFVAAWKAIGLTMDEATDTVNQFLIQLAESATGHGVDETGGMTLDELIPEAIAEWRQTKDEI